MQQVSEACSLDDDMVDGDLGDGMGVRTSASSTRKKSQSFAGVTDAMLPGPEQIRRSSQIGEAARILGLKTTDAQNKAGWKLSRSDSLVELSKDELTVRLQEATEMVDLLCCELEAAHRYLEGKYEALKILQGKAILDKATSHTKSLLQKSEERVKALEKEVNNLQWELSFTQIQMKRSQQTWEQKHSRLLNENKTLGENLEARESEVQQLQAENSALSRQCLELLSMLSVKEQKTYQESKPQFSAERDASVLELAVLGACQCLGAEACPCSRTAAASRKQLVQLQQKLEDQSSRREEALMVADAFRIAFEQQLRKRSEHFMLLAEANGLKSHYDKTEGVNRSPLLSVTQRLRGLLPSSLEVKMPDDLIETLYRLLDLLNDKEEALAHQRKLLALFLALFLAQLLALFLAQLLAQLLALFLALFLTRFLAQLLPPFLALFLIRFLVLFLTLFLTRFLAQLLPPFLALFLIRFLTRFLVLFLALFLALFLTQILALFLAQLLAPFLARFLTQLLALFLAQFLTQLLAMFLARFLTQLLTLFLTQYSPRSSPSRHQTCLTRLTTSHIRCVVSSHQTQQQLKLKDSHRYSGQRTHQSETRAELVWSRNVLEDHKPKPKKTVASTDDIYYSTFQVSHRVVDQLRAVFICAFPSQGQSGSPERT
ncbi:uncharacterized protein V6R79_002718 [Siganus canaliculatus]